MRRNWSLFNGSGLSNWGAIFTSSGTRIVVRWLTFKQAITYVVTDSLNDLKYGWRY